MVQSSGLEYSTIGGRSTVRLNVGVVRFTSFGSVVKEKGVFGTVTCQIVFSD